jgi:hypothetical protein
VNRVEKPLALARRELFGIVHASERRAQVAAVEGQDDGGGDYRPGPRAAPGLVNPGDQVIAFGKELMLQPESRHGNQRMKAEG